MKRFKHNFKKGMAFVLSLAMVAGLVPAMSGGANTVQAATGSGTEPSVTAYATKDQLMTAFTPDSNGTATTKGKLVFGKNENRTSQEWYILGKDTGVSGDNTIIFASSPIATGQVFNSDTSDKTYDSTTVNANHYGASNLRVALQNMAANTTYFTTAEQGIMNDTTVTTKDTRNGGTYTTTDKLYALQGDYNYNNNKKLWAGTNNQTVLAKDSYWNSGSDFWLRSPFANFVNGALLAIPGDYVYGRDVCSGYAVQPASNLNLSSVLFASAAVAASSDTVESDTIAPEAAMTLRLDGSSKNIGAVTYNTTTGDIKVAKGSTSQTVALVVQGNDGTNDWYYSKQITGTEVVNVTDIASATYTPASINLSTCKIWLETKDSTENLTYAVNATEILSITSVAITDIETPAVNTTLDTSASCATEGVGSTTPQITWTPSDTTAGYNSSYTASITLVAATGYEFTDSTTATVMGNAATSVTKNADGTLTVTYDFSATAKDKLTSITTQPGNATVKVGETATFTIAASGTDLTYQWQIDRNDGNGWVNIAGATATSYTTSTVNISCNGFKYQCVVSNSAGTVTSNTAVLTVTENTTPDPDPVDYEILDGANSSWEQNSDGSLSIRGSGEFSKFVGVKVDGNLVDANNYTVKEGSTIVTLKADYLNTLSVGSHTFEMIWTDGTASTTFTIKADSSDNGNNNRKDDVPKTGDDTPIVWLFILSILSGTGLIISVKKRRENLNS